MPLLTQIKRFFGQKPPAAVVSEASRSLTKEQAEALLRSKFPPLPTMFTFDESRERSLMFRAKQIMCNGAKTGQCCKHYWAGRRIPPSATPHLLKHGEAIRMCRAFGAEPLEFDDGLEGMFLQCNIYEADEKRPYDENFEKYDPITNEEVAELENEAVQARPLHVVKDEVLPTASLADVMNEVDAAIPDPQELP